MNDLADQADPTNNVSEHKIIFYPKLNRMSQMQCTCGGFDEWGTNMDMLAKLAVKHARKTGHILNPRGK